MKIQMMILRKSSEVIWFQDAIAVNEEMLSHSKLYSFMQFQNCIRCLKYIMLGTYIPTSLNTLKITIVNFK